MPSASPIRPPPVGPIASRMTKPITLSRIPSTRTAPKRAKKEARGPLGPSEGIGAPGGGGCGGGAGKSLTEILSLEDREAVQLEQPQRREDERRQQRRHPDADGARDEEDEGERDRGEPGRVGGERAAGMEVHDRLDARRHPAQRAGDARQPAERAHDPRMPRQRRQDERRSEHERAARPQVTRIQGQRSSQHGSTDANRIAPAAAYPRPAFATTSRSRNSSSPVSAATPGTLGLSRPAIVAASS